MGAERSGEGRSTYRLGAAWKTMRQVAKTPWFGLDGVFLRHLQTGGLVAGGDGRASYQEAR